MPLLIPFSLLKPRILLYVTLLLPMERSLALLVPSKPNSGRLRCNRIFSHFCHDSTVSIRILYPAEAVSFFSFFFGSFCLPLLLLPVVGSAAHRYSRCSRPIPPSPSS